MPSKKILICGGGIAGPALAFWLSRAGHKVRIVERSTTLRAQGAQIDLRGPGIEVIKRMGLDPAVRAKLVDEDGVQFVDTHGRILGAFMANKTGKGRQSLTSEYEIMRGDLVQILYDVTKDSENITYEFGRSVESFTEQSTNPPSSSPGVSVTFSDGATETFDMLIGADGQGSRIRRAMLGPAAADPLTRLGVHVAYWFIPTIASDSKMRSSYVAPGGRLMMRRTHSPDLSQAYCFLRDDSEELRSLPRAPLDKQKEFWAQRIGDAGWQAQRFVEGIRTTENFYCQEIVQVKADRWHSSGRGGGRVALLGDAAHCPSPFSGMGTTCALVGAYVMAGEIAREFARDDGEGSVQAEGKAFQRYESTLRPFIDEAQKVKPALIRLAMPQSRFAIMLIHWIVRLICWLNLPALISRFRKEEGDGWTLPDYSDVIGLEKMSKE